MTAEGSEARWWSLMQRLGLAPSLDMYRELLRLYGEPHRAYHNFEHIAACLRHLDDVRESAEKPDELELAIWFHDAIYKPFSGSNELDSAVLAADFLEENKAGEGTVANVHALIMATVHDASPSPGDSSLMVDIDLSILGARPEVYGVFEQAVRQEYRRVPGPIFRRKRRKLLQQFLDREKIYQHPHFFEKLEVQARRNLAAAIDTLSLQ